MATAEVTDSSDWLGTSLADFAPLETALRCQVCKDFYKTPVITSCSHTFCSLCIRRCLSADGRCPICRVPEQASKMRRNLVVEEVVNTFEAARASALTSAQATNRAQLTETNDYDGGDDDFASQQPRKRRKVVDETDSSQGAEARQTRSSARRQQLSSQSSSIAETVQQEDGLVACPMCGKRMKEELVFDHVGRCGETPPPPTAVQDKPPIRLATSIPSHSRERISEIQFDLLRDPAIRKKLQERGIPTWGSRELLKRRYTEWVNLWNAECDSEHPRPKRDLLRDLDTWERTLGGLAKDSVDKVSAPGSKGDKDFDAVAYAAKHKDDYTRLIEEAKRKLKQVKPSETSDLGINAHETAEDDAVAVAVASPNVIPSQAENIESTDAGTNVDTNHVHAVNAVDLLPSALPAED